jgi:hypothetical protein
VLREPEEHEDFENEAEGRRLTVCDLVILSVAWGDVLVSSEPLEKLLIDAQTEGADD